MDNNKRQDAFFTVGLLSTLDAFMDVPLDILLANLSLNQELSEALLAHSGAEGRVLDVVEHYERGEWDKIDWRYLEACKITPEMLSQAYIDALQWVSETMSQAGIDRP